MYPVGCRFVVFKDYISGTFKKGCVGIKGLHEIFFGDGSGRESSSLCGSVCCVESAEEPNRSAKKQYCERHFQLASGGESVIIGRYDSDGRILCSHFRMVY